MNKSLTDVRFIAGIFFAYLLIYVTFDSSNVFWYLYTATILFLISYSILNEKMDDEVPTSKYLISGVISGIALYILFFLADSLLSFLPGSLNKDVAKVYNNFSLDWIWHYLVLIFVIVPGEEIFWRGFVLKRLEKYMNRYSAVFLAALLNGGAFYFSGYPILMIAALVTGFVWGLLYIWKRSMPLVIISHLTFNLLLIIFLPLY